MIGRISFLRNTKFVGDVSEAKVIAAFVEAGYSVSIPFGENHRYDLVVELGNVLSRVQVKTGRVRKGAIIFNCSSSHTHRNGPHSRTYQGEVEFFAVYCPDTANVYLIPSPEISDAFRWSLRIAHAKNGQRKRIREASLYALDAANSARPGRCEGDGCSTDGMLPL